MTNKELRRLSRRELLELLIEQGKKAERLQEQLDEANAKLLSREIQVASAGSIAEAALRLNHIFEDAQAAADQYLENIKALSPSDADGNTEVLPGMETRNDGVTDWDELLAGISRESEARMKEFDDKLNSLIRLGAGDGR